VLLRVEASWTPLYSVFNRIAEYAPKSIG